MKRLITLLTLAMAFPAFGQFLMTETATQYNCMEGGQSMHYFHEREQTPAALPSPGSRNRYCHDIDRYGQDDSPQFPRLNSQENVFGIFSRDDRRFLDSNFNGKMDVNDQMEWDLRRYYNFNANLNLFRRIKMKNSPIAARGEEPELGVVLSYFVHRTTGIAICTDFTHYNSEYPVFRVIGAYVGRDTEAVYLGVEESSRGELDKVIIRKSLLDQISFRSGSQTNGDIYFHYPADSVDPYNRKPHQKLYRVRRPSEVGMEDQLGRSGMYLSHDKRFGCVPRL